MAKPEPEVIRTKCGPLTIEVDKGRKEHYVTLTQMNNNGTVSGKIMLDLDDLYKLSKPLNHAYDYLHQQSSEREITLEEMRDALHIIEENRLKK